MPLSFPFGAADQIRTGDLFLTKEVLCLLSYSSIRNSLLIISNNFQIVKHSGAFYRQFFVSGESLSLFQKHAIIGSTM